MVMAVDKVFTRQASGWPACQSEMDDKGRLGAPGEPRSTFIGHTTVAGEPDTQLTPQQFIGKLVARVRSVFVPKSTECYRDVNLIL